MSQCPRCGAGFTCAMVDCTRAAGGNTPSSSPPAPCWCTELPTLPAAALGANAATCYCAACLRHILADAAENNQK